MACLIIYPHLGNSHLLKISRFNTVNQLGAPYHYQEPAKLHILVFSLSSSFPFLTEIFQTSWSILPEHIISHLQTGHSLADMGIEPRWLIMWLSCDPWCRLIMWLIRWLIMWLIRWLITWLIMWPIKWLIMLPIEWLIIDSSCDSPCDPSSDSSHDSSCYPSGDSSHDSSGDLSSGSITWHIMWLLRWLNNMTNHMTHHVTNQLQVTSHGTLVH